MTAEVTEHPFLSIKGLDFAYGEVKVLYDLDFEIPQKFNFLPYGSEWSW